MRMVLPLALIATVSFATTFCLVLYFDPQRVRICPYGHTKLKKVEIVYSSPLLPRLDDKTQARIARQEAFVAPYSDVADLPKTTVLCQQCGFVLLGNWTRGSNDPSGFIQPFSSLLTDFPLPDKSRLTYLKYTQDLRGTYVASERLDYKTTDSLAVLKEKVRKWAEAYRLALVPPTLPEMAAYRPYPNARLMTEQVQSWGYGDPSARVTGHVLFASYPEEGIVFVDLLITSSGHVKGSINDALKVDQPNKAPEPTPGSVTPRAIEGISKWSYRK